MTTEPQPSLRERQIADLAGCAALSVSFGDPPQPALLALLQRFGYVDADGDLTDSGWEAAGDAMGFQDGD